MRMVFFLCLLPFSAFACPAFAPVPLSLSFASPYDQSDPTRSRVIPAAQAQMQAAIAPIDNALRQLSRLADALDEAESARCLHRRLSYWAAEDGLRDLRTDQVKLTIGARLAGFAILARRLRKSGAADLTDVTGWLVRRAQEQVAFWEEDAPPKARMGNLRAWADLAVWTIGDLADDKEMKNWAAASHVRILCSVGADGSLPIEMQRGRFSLHYQLHALNPLVTLAAMMVPNAQPCSEALVNAAEFALRDMEDGTKTQAITGHRQSYFTGEEQFQAHELAWVEAYLSLQNSPAAQKVARQFRPLRNSKLGGDQTAIWRH